MKTSLTLVSAIAILPAIAASVVLSTLTPAWLLPPALGFALFLFCVFALVRFFGLIVSLLLRLLVWVVAAGMIVAAVYAIALHPYHSVLAWAVVAAALLAIASTETPRPRLA